MSLWMTLVRCLKLGTKLAKTFDRPAATAQVASDLGFGASNGVVFACRLPLHFTEVPSLKWLGEAH